MSHATHQRQRAFPGPPLPGGDLYPAVLLGRGLGRIDQSTRPVGRVRDSEFGLLVFLLLLLLQLLVQLIPVAQAGEVDAELA